MNWPEHPLDILVVAPHPDDAELSVGGMILAARADGKRVGVLDLTNGEPTPNGSIEQRQRETDAATDVLDLSWRGNLGLPNRKLVDDLHSRRRLAEAFRRCRPHIVLGPYPQDVHPDHVAASRLIDDARFWAKLSRTDLDGEPFFPPKLYQFWSIHLRLREQPSVVIDVSDHMERKLDAIRCYASQFEGRNEQFPTILDDICDRARYWGWSIGTAYGEPLFGRETIGVRGLDRLL